MRRNASRFSSSRSIGWAVLFSAALHAGAFVSFSTGAPVDAQARQIEVQVIEAASPPVHPGVPEKPVAVLAPAHPSRPQPDPRARAAAQAKAASDSRRISEIVREGQAVCHGATGTWISLLLRLDRLRGQAVSQDAEALAQRLPILGEIAAANQSSVLETFDQVRISTAGTPGYGTVLLVAHHRLSEEAVRTAVIAAAQAHGYRTIEGSSEGAGVFEWRKKDAADAAPGVGPSAATAAPSQGGEERVVLLPEPGLIVVAERGLLDPLGTSAPTPGDRPSLRERLAALTDAGDPLAETLPPNAAGILSITSVPQGGAVPETDFVLGGRPNPHTLIAVLQLDPAPSLDIVAEFSQETNAEFWGSRWRALTETARGDLFGRPIHLLPLVRGARLVRREKALYVHEAVTRADLEGTLLLGARRSGPPGSTAP